MQYGDPCYSKFSVCVAASGLRCSNPPYTVKTLYKEPGQYEYQGFLYPTVSYNLHITKNNILYRPLLHFSPDISYWLVYQQEHYYELFRSNTMKCMGGPKLHVLSPLWALSIGTQIFYVWSSKTQPNWLVFIGFRGYRRNIVPTSYKKPLPKNFQTDSLVISLYAEVSYIYGFL